MSHIKATIKRLVKKPSKAVKEDESEALETTLSAVEAILDITLTAVDDVNIPGLKSVLAIASAIVKLVKVRCALIFHAKSRLETKQIVKENRADCLSLGEQVEGYTCVLEDFNGYKSEDISPEFSRALGKLHESVHRDHFSLLLVTLIIMVSRDLKNTLHDLAEIAKRKLFYRMIRAPLDKKRVVDHKEKLSNSFQAFQVYFYVRSLYTCTHRESLCEAHLRSCSREASSACRTRSPRHQSMSMNHLRCLT